MRKKIEYDKKYLAEVMRYTQVPVKQIQGLDLSLMEQALLIHLFSHSEDWGISFNKVSTSFGRKKNRKNIKQAFENIKRKGYIAENLDSYFIDLKRIQQDYLEQQNKGGSPANTVSEINTASEINRGVLTPLTGGVNQINRDTVNPAHTNYINNKIKKENKEINQTTNQLTHLDAISLLKSIKVHDHKCDPKNDLKLVIEECPQFKYLYEYEANKWYQYDINHLSNHQLANLVFIYQTNKGKFRNYSKLLLFISLLVKYSFQVLPELGLSNEFHNICVMNNQTELLEEYLLD